MFDMLDLLTEVKTFFEAGGFVMPPLMLATTLMWYCLGYRFWILRRSGKFSARQLAQRNLAGWDKKPADIVEEAAQFGVALKKRGVSDLRRYLDREFYQYEKELVRFGAIINTVVAIAPLMGLLGTVAGMIETFDSLAEMALFTQSGGIAGGISQALFTTQMGLVVAVPGLLIKSVQDRKQRRIQSELAQLKDLLCISAR
ncbi:MAG: MotA/TolQ/ExbB proton channel family protein [Methylobacter sp.]